MPVAIFDMDGVLYRGNIVMPHARETLGRLRAAGWQVFFATNNSTSSRADYVAQADSAVRYARSMPDIVNVTADSLGHRLTLQFRSGWRTMVVPIDDGKRGGETANLPRR